MKKLTEHRLKAWSERIPRKTRFFLYVLSILFLAFLIYIFIGAPALNWQHRYRRIEKAHLVGPGQILGYEEVSGSLYDAAVVARTDKGVIVTTMISELPYGELLFYLPMTGKIAVTAAPQMLAPSDIDFEQDTLTVFVVDDYPEAVRAELDLQLYFKQQPDGEAETPIFHLSGQREKDGYFRLDTPFESLDADSVERKALDLYSDYTRNAGWRETLWLVPKGAYKATVRLYDSNDSMIAEETITLFD